MFVNCSQNGQFGLYQNQYTFRKIHSLPFYGRGSFTTASALCLPHLSPLCRYTTHSSVPHTATVEMSCLQHCSTDGKLRILVKAQPCTPSTWPLSPTRLGMRPRDLGLSNEYTLGHCGLSAASRHKLASTSRHSYQTNHSAK